MQCSLGARSRIRLACYHSSAAWWSTVRQMSAETAFQVKTMCRVTLPREDTPLGRDSLPKKNKGCLLGNRHTQARMKASSLHLLLSAANCVQRLYTACCSPLCSCCVLYCLCSSRYTILVYVHLESTHGIFLLFSRKFDRTAIGLRCFQLLGGSSAKELEG